VGVGAQHRGDRESNSKWFALHCAAGGRGLLVNAADNDRDGYNAHRGARNCFTSSGPSRGGHVAPRGSRHRVRMLQGLKAAGCRFLAWRTAIWAFATRSRPGGLWWAWLRSMEAAGGLWWSAKTAREHPVGFLGSGPSVTEQ